MPPSRALPPVVIWRGTSPSQAARSRPCAKSFRLADRRRQRRGVQGADAGDRRQPPRRRRTARASRRTPDRAPRCGRRARPIRERISSISILILGLSPDLSAPSSGSRASPSARRPFATVIAALEQDRPQLVDQPRAAVHQPRTRPMQRLLVELHLRLQRHEPHGRPRRRLGDRLGVAVVVLLRLHIRLDVFRRHQPHLVALRLEEPPEVMRAATRLHRHHAGRQPAHELGELRPRHAPPQNHGAAAVQRRHAAAVLPQINPDDRYGHQPLPFSQHAPADAMRYRRRRGGPSHKRRRMPASRRATDIADAPRGLVRAPARARPGEARLHRRDRCDHQDGPPARAQPPRRALPRRGPAWPLEDDDAGRGPAPRRPHRAHGHRRGDERRRLHRLCRDLPRTHPRAGRHRHPRQSAGPQGQRRPRGDRSAPGRP